MKYDWSDKPLKANPGGFNNRYDHDFLYTSYVATKNDIRANNNYMSNGKKWHSLVIVSRNNPDIYYWIATFDFDKSIPYRFESSEEALAWRDAHWEEWYAIKDQFYTLCTI